MQKSAQGHYDLLSDPSAWEELVYKPEPVRTPPPAVDNAINPRPNFDQSWSSRAFRRLFFGSKHFRVNVRDATDQLERVIKCFGNNPVDSVWAREREWQKRNLNLPLDDEEA
jgi:hypothetical protein